MEFEVGDVVQFTENHKWCGSLGIVEEIKELESDVRYMVGVPIPERGTAYIFTLGSKEEIEYVGQAVMVPDRGSEDESN